MAKQLVNPIERHVEKAALGIAGFLLLTVIVKYVVTAPNQLELGGESVSPSSIDQKVAQKAASVRKRIREARADVEMPEPLHEDFLDELDPFQHAALALTLPAVVGIGPEVPLIDEGQRPIGQAELVKVVPTGKPAIAFGRSTFLMRNLYVPVNWVTISAVFDVKQQMAEQQRECGTTRKEAIFGPVHLQRRACREDGSWREEDWEFVEPWPAGTVPPIPTVSLVQEENHIIVEKEDRDNVEQFFELLSQPRVQLDLLRPMMPEKENGDNWTFPVLTSYRDVLMQDDQYLYPNDPPAANPADRYREEEEGVPGVAEELTPAERIAKEFAEIDRLLKSAWENMLESDAILAYNLAMDIEHDKDASPSDKNKAARLKQQAEQDESDIRRIKRSPDWKGRQQPAMVDEEEPSRQPLPIQQMWVHDAKAGSVEDGRTCQYRLRPTIYNRLAGQPDKFSDPRNAAILLIPGEWTEPVEVTIEPATVFFVTSKDERKGEVGVDLPLGHLDQKRHLLDCKLKGSDLLPRF